MTAAASDLRWRGIRALLRPVRARVREPAFWVIQAGVLAITAAHVAVEAVGYTLDQRAILLGLHHIPVILYLLPIAYAGLRYGLEGAVLTGAWCMLLTVPNMVIWHPHGWEWVGELAYVTLVAAIGVVIAVPVERERRRSEQLAATSRRLARLIRGVTRAQEEERRRVALELHDTTSQELVGLNRKLDDLAARASDPSLRQELTTVRATSAAMLDGLRRLSRDLRPSVLDDLGLPAAIEWLATDLRSRGTAAQARTEGSARRLSQEVELAVFRISQEALRNVERHADAERVTVALTFTDGEVRVAVEDDGRGFDPAGVAEPGHDVLGRLGLVGMRERAELVGGNLSVRSRPGQGTRVDVVVPTV